MASPKYGKALKELFLFAPGWRNMNHGSFGAVPRDIKNKQIEFQLQEESNPDKYIRFDLPKLIDASREAVAKLINAPTNTVTLVANATTAVNVVLRNIIWDQDGKDEILSFSIIYGGCGNTIDFIVDTNELVSSRVIPLQYPIEDDEVVDKFREAIRASKAAGKRPKLACYDTVSSLPGLCFPYQAITDICREEGILSLVDGAQGVGMIPLDMEALDADFFFSNCHKWLDTPKGNAVLYVPERNQHMMVSSLPTSHGYVPQNAGLPRSSPFPKEPSKPPYVELFQFVGSIDTSAYAVLDYALEWRAKNLGTEDQIREYIWTLAKEGGAKVAQILGTQVLNNAKATLLNSGMVNVWLPIQTSNAIVVASHPHAVILTEEESRKAAVWTQKLLTDEYKTFMPIFTHGGQWCARLSAQVYLDMEDFEWSGQVLKEIVERVRSGEYNH